VVYDKKFSHSSLLSGLCFAVSQIHWVAARIKIHLSNPSVERTTEIVQHFEQVFYPCRMTFKELKVKKEAVPYYNISVKKRTLNA